MPTRLVVGFGVCEITKDFASTPAWFSAGSSEKETNPQTYSSPGASLS